MRPTLQPIEAMETEWAATGRSTEARGALRRLAAAEVIVAELGCHDLVDLVQTLRATDGPASRVRSARIFQAMLRSQEVHPLVPRAILQAAVPGLVGVARRLSWGSGGDWRDGGAFFADLMATAWEVIVAWSGEDRPYAVLDLLSAVRCRVRRQMLHQRSDRERLTGGIEVDDRLLPAAPVGVTDLEHLARAIDDLAAHGLDPADAAVIYGHRVLGLSMAELSRMTGRTRRHLDGRRVRAEQALCG